MEKAIRHWVTNLSGIGALIAFCFQNFLAAQLGEAWTEVSWGWLSLVLSAVWFGAQIRQWENGNHWLQEVLANRSQFVTATLRKQGPQERYIYFADLRFTKHAENVIVRVETYRRLIKGFGGNGYEWKRGYAVTAINRAACNKGHQESIKLMECLKDAQAFEETVINAFGPQPALGPRRSKPSRSAVWKVELGVTAAGRDAFVETFHFWGLEGGLFELPALPPVAANGADLPEFGEGTATWLIE